MIATKLFDDLDLGETRSWRDKLHRWLDPKVGRWISEDPIGFAAGDANVYRYVGNGPTSRVDPSGLHDGPSHPDYTDTNGRVWRYDPFTNTYRPIEYEEPIWLKNGHGLQPVPLVEQPVFWLAAIIVAIWRPMLPPDAPEAPIEPTPGPEPTLSPDETPDWFDPCDVQDQYELEQHLRVREH